VKAKKIEEVDTIFDKYDRKKKEVFENLEKSNPKLSK
jgi:hypothetical protein